MKNSTLLATSDCNFLANLSFTRPRLSPNFLTRLHETTRPGSYQNFLHVHQSEGPPQDSD